MVTMKKIPTEQELRLHASNNWDKSIKMQSDVVTTHNVHSMIVVVSFRRTRYLIDLHWVNRENEFTDYATALRSAGYKDRIPMKIELLKKVDVIEWSDYLILDKTEATIIKVDGFALCVKRVIEVFRLS